MFQTEPILFLQGFASAWLTWALATVTAMGYAPFYVAVVGAVMLALDLRRGFVVAQLVIWTNLVTDIAKWSFAWPRPTDVDAAVVDPRTGAANPIEWHGRGGAAFLALPDAEAVASFRMRPYRSFGFPSGHVSTTVALWGGLTAVFARRWLLACTLVAAPLMALSRMYLGRHFLADVLGGALLGGLLVVAARGLLTGERAPVPLLRLTCLASLGAPRRLAVVLWLVAAPLALTALGGIVDRQRIGQLLGLNLAYLALAARGLPAEAPGWPRALARVAIGVAIGYLAWHGVGALARLGPPGAGTAFARVASGIPPAFLLLWGTVTIGRRLGLYRAG
jgi:membrane-associated phospholipid phosphatase